MARQTLIFAIPEHPAWELPLFPEMRPSKITAFEAELERLLRDRSLSNEVDVMQVCFDHGVKREHAEPSWKGLKIDGVIHLDFGVPDIKRLNHPRSIKRTASGFSR